LYSNESLTKEISALEILSNGTIDGFIVCSEEAQKITRLSFEIINDGTPIVMFDRIADGGIAIR
jgi:LacI family transcriptional regulator